MTTALDSPFRIIRFASVEITSATTTTLATASAGNRIYVLSLSFTIISGTNPTIRFTGDTNFPGGTQTFATAANTPQHFHSATGLFRSAVAGTIDAVTAGTITPTFAVSIAYIELPPTGTPLLDAS